MFWKCPNRIAVFSSAVASDTQRRSIPTIAVILIFIVRLHQWCVLTKWTDDRQRPSEQRLVNCCCVLVTQCEFSCVLALALCDLQAESLDPVFLSGVVAKVRIKLHQCIRGILQVLDRQILPITPNFSATDLERLRVTHVTRMEDFRIKNPGCF